MSTKITQMSVSTKTYRVSGTTAGDHNWQQFAGHTLAEDLGEKYCGHELSAVLNLLFRHSSDVSDVNEEEESGNHAYGDVTRASDCADTTLDLACQVKSMSRIGLKDKKKHTKNAIRCCRANDAVVDLYKGSCQ